MAGVDAAFARIWMLEPGADTLTLCTSVGLYTHLDGPHSRVKVGESKLGRIAATRIPLETNSIVTEPDVDADWAREQGIVSFAGYPLVVQERLVGVVVDIRSTAAFPGAVQGPSPGGQSNQPRNTTAANGGGTPDRQRESRRGHHGEVDVPRQHEPRDPHTDERHHRHDAPGPENRADPEAARLPLKGANRRRLAARHHQRHSRLLKDRGRQAGHRECGLPLRGRAGESLHRGRTEGPREESRIPHLRLSRTSRRISSAIHFAWGRS